MAEDLFLNQFKPKSFLVNQVTEIKRPKFPLIDAHNHLEISR